MRNQNLRKILIKEGIGCLHLPLNRLQDRTYQVRSQGHLVESINLFRLIARFSAGRRFCQRLSGPYGWSIALTKNHQEYGLRSSFWALAKGHILSQSAWR